MKQYKVIKSVISIFVVLSVVLSAVSTSSAITYHELKKNNSYRYGIDVSLWNDDLDWSLLKKEGVEFAYIRIGYYNNSGGHLDKRFIQNVVGCVENGIEFGVYVYSYVYSISDNINCAKWINRELKKLGNYCKDKDTIPVAYDIEDPVQINALRYGRISKDYLQLSLEKFCTKIRELGYIPTIYSFSSFFESYLDVERLQKSNIKIWIAHWPNFNYINITRKVKHRGVYPDVWQYGCSLRIAGTVFDTNVCYDDFYDYNNEDSKLRIEGLEEFYHYTGSEIEPELKVYNGEKLLKENKHYKLVYFNNILTGKARIKIIRYVKGKYKETKTVPFVILDDKIDAVSVKSTKHKISFQWSEANDASYYEIYLQDEFGEYFLLEETELNYSDLIKLNRKTLYRFKIRSVMIKENEKYYGQFVEFKCKTK